MHHVIPHHVCELWSLIYSHTMRIMPCPAMCCPHAANTNDVMCTSLMMSCAHHMMCAHWQAHHPDANDRWRYLHDGNRGAGTN